MSADNPTVRLELESRPETLTLVRGALGGIAERLGLDPELLDDLKTAVSEACNNVVLHAYDGESGPMGVCLYTRRDTIEVIVRDQGVGMPALRSSDDLAPGVGLPVIRALTERAEFLPIPDGGTEVRMTFSGERAGEPLYQELEQPAPDDDWMQRLSGDALVSLSPIDFLGAVLGRLARAQAASARFSLDRFSDVYLVTDAIAAHAASTSSGDRIGFGIGTRERRLELTVGPFREGSGAQLREERGGGRSGSALTLLSDELDCTETDGSEVLHVVMLDRRRGEAAEQPLSQ